MTLFYYDRATILSSRSFVSKIFLKFLLLSVIYSTPIHLVNFCPLDFLPHTFSSACLFSSPASSCLLFSICPLLLRLSAPILYDILSLFPHIHFILPSSRTLYPPFLSYTLSSLSLIHLSLHPLIHLVLPSSHTLLPPSDRWPSSHSRVPHLAFTLTAAPPVFVCCGVFQELPPPPGTYAADVLTGFSQVSEES